MHRAGVAGVGNLGKVHLETLLKCSDVVKVAALADPVPERRAGRGLKTADFNIDLGDDRSVTVDDIRSYDDFSGLCRDPELDLVCIAMPSDLHAPAAIMALEHGKHVFTEKPMALSNRDCARLLDAAAANGRTLMVGQVLRFWPEYMEAGRLMKSGRYGRVLSAVMHRYSRHPGRWFAEHKHSGGVRLDLHIHDVDAALFWWGEPAAVRAQAVGDTANTCAVLSQWRYPDGPIVQMEAVWDSGSTFGADFRIVLEEATLSFDMCNGAGLRIAGRDGTAVAPVPKDGSSAYEAELVYFMRCIREGQPVERCMPEQSALSVRYALKGGR